MVKTAQSTIEPLLEVLENGIEMVRQGIYRVFPAIIFSLISFLQIC